MFRFVNKVDGCLDIFVRLAGISDHQCHTGNQLLRFIIESPWINTLGHSSIGNGAPLLGMICFASRTDPVSKPINGDSAFLRAWVLKRGK